MHSFELNWTLVEREGERAIAWHIYMLCTKCEHTIRQNNETPKRAGWVKKLQLKIIGPKLLRRAHERYPRDIVGVCGGVTTGVAAARKPAERK